jgi:hypothetical protein
MEWLVADARPHDMLFFHCKAHHPSINPPFLPPWTLNPH